MPLTVTFLFARCHLVLLPGNQRLMEQSPNQARPFTPDISVSFLYKGPDLPSELAQAQIRSLFLAETCRESLRVCN